MVIVEKIYEEETFYVDDSKLCEKCKKNHTVENTELCPECYVERRRELYKRSWENKWSNYEDEYFDTMEYCPFCRDARVRYHKSNIAIKKLQLIISYDGDPCAPFCLIGKDICGSKDSIFNNLEDVGETRTDDGKTIVQYRHDQLEQIALTIKQRGGVE